MNNKHEQSIIAILPSSQSTTLVAPTSEIVDKAQKIVAAFKLQQNSSLKQKQESSNINTPQSPSTEKYFQAIGRISGIVKIKDNHLTITIDNSEYNLYSNFNPRGKKAYDLLKQELEINGEQQFQLTVYPKVTHFPKKDEPHKINFALVRFNKEDDTKMEGITSTLSNFEFRLCGIWQFIPACSVPCISVFRNYDENRLNYIKKLSPDRKVRFMKPSHVPVVGSIPVKPFRFNPKIDKDKQGKTSFVEVKALFNPRKNMFELIQTYSAPTTEKPKCFKVSRDEKTRALKESRSSNKN